MRKRVWLSLVFFAFLSFLCLQASDYLDIRLRVFEGIRQGPVDSPEFVTSSYLQPTVTASIPVGFELEKELKHIKRVFNLLDVNLLTEADLRLDENHPDSKRHYFRLNGNEFIVYVSDMKGSVPENLFLIVVNEHLDNKMENILTTSMTLVGRHIAVFGFENREGKPYFLSFHVTGPKEKLLLPPPPPPPPPPPMSKELKEKIKEFEKGAVKAVGKIKPPRVIQKIKPVYPEGEPAAGKKGPVTLNVRVDKQGRVSRILILRGQSDLLNKAAVEAVRQWTYEPLFIDKKPVEVVFTVRISFVRENHM
jgi:TonB family protein